MDCSLPCKSTGVGCHCLLCPFSSRPQSCPASGSFQMSQPFASGGQSLGVNAWRLVLFAISSTQFSCSVMSDSLRPHGLQHARLPYPSPIPRDCSNSCPSSWWCHPTISSSLIPFFSSLQSFLASGSFPRRQFFASGGRSIGVSASISVLPMNTQD